MKIAFVTLAAIDNINKRGIYTDLIRNFIERGHYVYIFSPLERGSKASSNSVEGEGYKIIRFATFKMQKANYIEKTLGMLSIDFLLKRAFKKSKIEIDLLIYTTPPITLTKAVKYIKNASGAHTYLLLKDIFPQCLVDLEVIKKSSKFYDFLRKKEEELYALSDYIGCMSPANVNYVIDNNIIDKNKVELCPNSIIPIQYEAIDKRIWREKYDLPKDVRIFFYGGNLGMPQNIDFVIKILESNKDAKDRFFLIIGNGTEYGKLKSWIDKHQPENVRLLGWVEKEIYDSMIKCVDVGMIFLDPRYTIPNFPSRLLPYLENQLPTLSATDTNTDIGDIAVSNNFGLSSVSGDLAGFNSALQQMVNLSESELKEMGLNGYNYLLSNYTCDNSSNIIFKHFDQ